MIASAKRSRPPAAAPQGRRKLTTEETRCLSSPCEIANRRAGHPEARAARIRKRLIGQRHCCSRRARSLLTARRERRSVALRGRRFLRTYWLSSPRAVSSCRLQPAQSAAVQDYDGVLLVVFPADHQADRDGNAIAPWRRLEGHLSSGLQHRHRLRLVIEPVQERRKIVSKD